MTREQIQLGETYYLPVVATEFVEYGNMIRVVTEDEGEVIYARPEALHKAKKTIEVMTITRGERNGQKRKSETGKGMAEQLAPCL